MARYRFTVTFLDGDGKSAIREGFVEDATSQASAVSKIQGLLSSIDDFILGQIIACELGVPISLPVDLKSSPGADADREVRASFAFNSNVAKVYPSITIPTFDKATWTVTGGSIDTSTGATADFVSAMIADGFCDYRGADITSLKEAKESFA